MRFDRKTLALGASLLSGLLLALTPGAAFAHAQLEKAVPGVGATITAAPEAITLAYSEPVAPHFCGVTLSDAAGKPVPLGKPASAAGNTAALVVPVKAKLAPGTYTVIWHAVSVDTHRTQGKFTFTLAP